MYPIYPNGTTDLMENTENGAVKGLALAFRTANDIFPQTTWRVIPAILFRASGSQRAADFEGNPRPGDDRSSAAAPRDAGTGAGQA